MSVFMEQGYRITGYDIDDTQMHFSVKEHGLPLKNQEFSSEGHPHDLILLRHVLEHFGDPVEELKKMRARLKPEGLLYIEVPGIRSASRGKYDYDLRPFFVIEHIFTFELGTLVEMAKKAGLELVEGDESVSAVFRRSGTNSSGSANSVAVEASGSPWKLLEELRETEKRYRKNRLRTFIKKAIEPVPVLRSVRPYLS